MEGSNAKRRKLSCDEKGERLRTFMNWANEQNIQISSKVSAAIQGTAAHCGLMASDSIKAGEMIFSLPRSVSLSAATCSISQLLSSNDTVLQSASGWVPLLLALMHEKTTPSSKWRPYLDAFPNFDGLELPMFWTEQDLNCELSGTGISDAVRKDLANMAEEFNNIALPFIRQHKDIFSQRCEDFEFYKETAAFVMAYSFTDDVSLCQITNSGNFLRSCILTKAIGLLVKPHHLFTLPVYWIITVANCCSSVSQQNQSVGRIIQSINGAADDDSDEDSVKPTTVMVPMADLLNHVCQHNAELKLGENTFRMIAVRDIMKGEEIFNTYGKQSNFSLLLMYGFALPENENVLHESLEIPCSTVRHACELLSWEDNSAKWKYLYSKGVTEDETVCLTDEGLVDCEVLCVLFLTKEELQSKLIAKDQPNEDGWESDEEAEDLMYDTIQRLEERNKQLLNKMAELMMEGLPKETLESIDKCDMSQRQLFSLYVRSSYRRLLNKLIIHTS